MSRGGPYILGFLCFTDSVFLRLASVAFGFRGFCGIRGFWILCGFWLVRKEILSILSYPTLPYRTLSYPILPYPTLSYPILSYPILSYRSYPSYPSF